MVGLETSKYDTSKYDEWQDGTKFIRSSLLRIDPALTIQRLNQPQAHRGLPRALRRDGRLSVFLENFSNFDLITSAIHWFLTWHDSGQEHAVLVPGPSENYRAELGLVGNYLLAVGLTSAAVWSFDAHSGAFSHSLLPARRRSTALAFRPDGGAIAITTKDGTVQRLDLKSGRFIQPAVLAPEDPSKESYRLGRLSLSFLPDSSLQVRSLIPGFGTLPPGDLETVWTIPAAGGQVRPLSKRLLPRDPPSRTASARSPDGRLQVVPAQDGSVSVREAVGGKERWRTARLLRSPVEALAFSPDSTLLVLSGEDGELAWLRVRDGAMLLRMQMEAVKESTGAMLVSADQHTAVLGQMRAPWRWAVCRCGAEAVPWPLCNDAQEEPDLLARVLRVHALQ